MGLGVQFFIIFELQVIRVTESVINVNITLTSRFSLQNDLFTKNYLQIFFCLFSNIWKKKCGGALTFEQWVLMDFYSCHLSRALICTSVIITSSEYLILSSCLALKTPQTRNSSFFFFCSFFFFLWTPSLPLPPPSPFISP